jgi:hypothetical protein
MIAGESFGELKSRTENKIASRGAKEREFMI